ncbi:MAG: nucleotidyl transferase AbiEii/AbiGii toxin family protein [Verrucomicrobiae bacterium]|nr:nucleotidyl transferase AbiEii/AbiGii toxin family protein [Verrucomicrobiae bacterium]
MGKRQLTPEFREFLACLNRAGVEYLLVGGYAVNHYGYHRFTEDIDFWIAVSDENFDRLLAAIREFFGEGLAGLDKNFLQQNEALFLGAVPNRIEVFKHCSGLEFSEAYRRREETALDDEPVKLISLADLRINKRASGRNKDLADLDNLPEVP